MINVFDLSAGMTGTNLLSEKAHRDGSPVYRNQHAVANKVLVPVGVQIEDKPVTHELKRSSSNKKSNGTPIKMLIAREMSKGTERKGKPTGVVARLMGLDALPVQQHVPIAPRSIPDGYAHNSRTHGGPIGGYRQQDDAYSGKTMLCDVHAPQDNLGEHSIYKDVYEVQQQPFKGRTNCFKDQHLLRGRYNENPNEKRALVCQKFMEAKRLARDQKHLHSKEFQDALEVLSSNRDLFLKFLEEPNSLISKHLHELQIAPLPSQKKRITVLKPSKKAEARNEKPTKADNRTDEWKEDKSNLSWTSSFVHPKSESLSQTTRIVVLKPSPRKHQDIKDAVSYHAESLGPVGRIDSFQESGSGDSKGSREVAKEVTRQMKGSLSSDQRDESLLSSIVSYGYTGDESSFNRSENEYIEQDGGNFSDSEIATPPSCHSWDYVNRFGSPYSLYSFSRASHSPESSVGREAKRRLSERWAMVTSNGINQEEGQLRRSSNTLGDMLAFPVIKKVEGSNEVLSSTSCGGEQELRVLTYSSISTKEDEIGGKDFSKNLLRSKSVPVSSSAYEKVVSNMEKSISEVDKSTVPKAVTKSKSGKSSFKGKMSSLFSRNKRPIGEKDTPSHSVVSHEKFQPDNPESVGKTSDISSVGGRHGHGNCSSTLENDGMKPDIPSAEAAPSTDKRQTSENTTESQDQPSPISVLDAPFESDLNNTSSESSGGTNQNCCKRISRSPPIESVSRTLSWDNSYTETTLSNSLTLPRFLSRLDEEEQNRFVFVQALLSSAGLANEKSEAALARWHSHESPLNPILLHKFLNPQEEVANCRERRSNRRLLFDCVNAVLMDISCTDPMETYLCTRLCAGAGNCVPHGAPLTDEVWCRVKEWFSCENLVTVQNDSSSRFVEGVVRNEVVGRRWVEMMGSETEEFAKEIERHVLEELVGEALDDLISGLL